MNSLRHIPATLLVTTLLTLPAWAQTPAGHDHSHGQDTPAATPQAAPATPPAPAAARPDDAWSQQIRRMKEVHVRTVNAKSPAEQKKALAEGRQLMQQGMEMMQRMHEAHDHGHGKGGMMDQGMMDKGSMQGGMAGKPEGTGSGSGMGMHDCMAMHGMMEKRMQMMETMLQMMLDQQTGGTAKK